MLMQTFKEKNKQQKIKHEMCPGINFWTNKKVPDAIIKTILIHAPVPSPLTNKINTCGGCFHLTTSIKYTAN